MKVSLFLSGHIRTLFYHFHHNINLIKNTLGDCEIDIFYSFWDDCGRVKFPDNCTDPTYVNAENFICDNFSIETINDYFISNGVNNVDGEIESHKIIDNIVNDFPIKLKPYPSKIGLRSQYYKLNRVVQKYFTNDYDVYVRIRPDIKINNFPNIEFINKMSLENSIIVNSEYWYRAPYNRDWCNEMVWITDKNSFKESNEIFLNFEKLVNQMHEHFGEKFMAKNIQNMLSDGIIDNVLTFNFDYKLIR